MIFILLQCPFEDRRNCHQFTIILSQYLKGLSRQICVSFLARTKRSGLEWVTFLDFEEFLLLLEYEIWEKDIHVH